MDDSSETSSESWFAAILLAILRIGNRVSTTTIHYIPKRYWLWFLYRVGGLSVLFLIFWFIAKTSNFPPYAFTPIFVFYYILSIIAHIIWAFACVGSLNQYPPGEARECGLVTGYFGLFHDISSILFIIASIIWNHSFLLGGHNPPPDFLINSLPMLFLAGTTLVVSELYGAVVWYQWNKLNRENKPPQ